MKNPFLSRLNQWIIFVIFTTIAVGGLMATMTLINYLRKEEIKRIDLFVKAIKFQQDVTEPDDATQALVLEIYKSNNTIPVIILDKDGVPMFHRNIPSDIENHQQSIIQYALKMGDNYPPIELKFPNGNNQFVYYDNSYLLNILQYSPYAVACFILLYLLFSFWFLRTIKKTDEGFLWAGLAKETAHQIGTPLSSMIGWVEILKTVKPQPIGVDELSKDVQRLETISQRFSKIGSTPELCDHDLQTTIEENFNYLKSRLSAKVVFQLYIAEGQYEILHNKILLSWVIENLVKNAVDAMKGEGHLIIKLYEKNKKIYIDFRDNGIGMSSSKTRSIFKPGYSTKKRGWGLGLSLAKRVIEDYHNGEIKVAYTETGRGTTFRIIFRK